MKQSFKEIEKGKRNIHLNSSLSSRANKAYLIVIITGP
jgi:hypothetical protein